MLWCIDLRSHKMIDGDTVSDPPDFLLEQWQWQWQWRYISSGLLIATTKYDGWVEENGYVVIPKTKSGPFSSKLRIRMTWVNAKVTYSHDGWKRLGSQLKDNFYAYTIYKWSKASIHKSYSNIFCRWMGNFLLPGKEKNEWGMSSIRERSNGKHTRTQVEADMKEEPIKKKRRYKAGYKQCSSNSE